MKNALLLCLLLASCAATSPETPMEMSRPDPARPHDPQAFLERFVGDWSIVTVASMGPDAEPMRMESEESVRRLGDWILAEAAADLAGQPFHSVLTLGYDTLQAAFVGSWIDSMSTHLWVYRGWLDASGNVLTLEAEGPEFENPSVTRVYRDTTEFDGPDHRVLTSTVLMDGEWIEYMRADYSRQQ